MDANREPEGPREAPTGSEAGEHHEDATAGSATIVSSVVAPCLRESGEDVFVLSGGGRGYSPRGW